MKIASNAAAMRNGCVASESWNAFALPVNVVVSPAGIPSERSLFLIAVTACPRDAPGARLKESVTAGNWPSWFTVSGAEVRSRLVKDRSGTGNPVFDGT